MVGSWQEDLIYCLRMKTTDKTLNLRFSETIAMKENGTAFRGQAVQWCEDRLPLLLRC